MHVNTEKQNIYQAYNDDMPANLILEFALLSIIYNWSLTKKHYIIAFLYRISPLLWYNAYCSNFYIQLCYRTEGAYAKFLQDF